MKLYISEPDQATNSGDAETPTPSQSQDTSVVITGNESQISLTEMLENAITKNDVGAFLAALAHINALNETLEQYAMMLEAPQRLAEKLFKFAIQHKHRLNTNIADVLWEYAESVSFYSKDTLFFAAQRNQYAAVRRCFAAGIRLTTKDTKTSEFDALSSEQKQRLDMFSCWYNILDLCMSAMPFAFKEATIKKKIALICENNPQPFIDECLLPIINEEISSPLTAEQWNNFKKCLLSLPASSRLSKALGEANLQRFNDFTPTTNESMGAVSQDTLPEAMRSIIDAKVEATIIAIRGENLSPANISLLQGYLSLPQELTTPAQLACRREAQALLRKMKVDIADILANPTLLYPELDTQYHQAAKQYYQTSIQHSLVSCRDKDKQIVRGSAITNLVQRGTYLVLQKALDKTCSDQALLEIANYCAQHSIGCLGTYFIKPRTIPSFVDLITTHANPDSPSARKILYRIKLGYYPLAGQDRMKSTLALELVRLNRLKEADSILAHAPGPRSLDLKSTEGITGDAWPPFIYACAFSNIDTVDELLRMYPEIDINAKYRRGSAIHAAIFKDRPEVIERLVADARLVLSTGLESALRFAITRKTSSCLRAILPYYNDLQLKGRMTSFLDALHSAVVSGSIISSSVTDDIQRIGQLIDHLESIGATFDVEFIYLEAAEAGNRHSKMWADVIKSARHPAILSKLLMVTNNKQSPALGACLHEMLASACYDLRTDMVTYLLNIDEAIAPRPTMNEKANLLMHLLLQSGDRFGDRKREKQRILGCLRTIEILLSQMQPSDFTNQQHYQNTFNSMFSVYCHPAALAKLLEHYDGNIVFDSYIYFSVEHFRYYTIACIKLLIQDERFVLAEQFLVKWYTGILKGCSHAERLDRDRCSSLPEEVMVARWKQELARRIYRFLAIMQIPQIGTQAVIQLSPNSKIAIIDAIRFMQNRVQKLKKDKVKKINQVKEEFYQTDTVTCDLTDGLAQIRHQLALSLATAPFPMTNAELMGRFQQTFIACDTPSASYERHPVMKSVQELRWITSALQNNRSTFMMQLRMRRAVDNAIAYAPDLVADYTMTANAKYRSTFTTEGWALFCQCIRQVAEKNPAFASKIDITQLRICQPHTLAEQAEQDAHASRLLSAPPQKKKSIPVAFLQKFGFISTTAEPPNVPETYVDDLSEQAIHYINELVKNQINLVNDHSLEITTLEKLHRYLCSVNDETGESTTFSAEDADVLRQQTESTGCQIFDFLALPNTMHNSITSPRLRQLARAQLRDEFTIQLKSILFAIHAGQDAATPTVPGPVPMP